jgi:hypothetical protein
LKRARGEDVFLGGTRLAATRALEKVIANGIRLTGDHLSEMEMWQIAVLLAHAGAELFNRGPQGTDGQESGGRREM